MCENIKNIKYHYTLKRNIGYICKILEIDLKYPIKKIKIV